MNIISDIITTLTDEERTSFVSSLHQKNKRHDTKNVALFKLLATNPAAQNIDLHIYGKKAKGAYHALSKRLFDSLVDFVATKSFEGEQSEEMEIIKLLLASRILFEQKAYKVALKIIKKAEEKALDYELYGILNEIYYTRIQYAHEDKNKALEELISRFKKNKVLFQQEENLNLFYASTHNTLLHSRENVQQTMIDNLTKFDISIDSGLTYRSLFKIVEINNAAANTARDFHSLLPFIEKVNKEIALKQKLSEKHLFYHIQILYYIANAYFRNKNFIASKNYLAQMNTAMQKQQGAYYERFLPQYTLVQILNLNYSGDAATAISIIRQLDFENFKPHIAYVMDLKLTAAVIFLQQNSPKEALSIFKESRHSDLWYASKGSEIWVIKKNLVEIILYIEMDLVDLVESKIKSFRKKHTPYLKANNEIRVLEFLKLASYYYQHKAAIISEDFILKVKKTLTSAHREKEDVFVLSFYAWLKAKVMKTDVYKTTLEAVCQN